MIASSEIQHNIFNEYNPHLLSLFLNQKPTLQEKPKFSDLVKKIGLNTVLQILGNKYTIQELKKAYDFYIGITTGVLSNIHHQELYKGFNLGLYEEILKYYCANAFDAASNGAENSVTSLTIAHTVTGSNLIGFCGVGIGNATDWITGITWNGSAMTRINTQIIGGAANNRGYLYYILAPTTGNIVISSSNAVNIRAANASYTGAKQSGVPDASGTTSTGSTNTITSTLTSVLDGCWHVSFVNDDQGTLVAGTGTTSRAVTSPASSRIGDNNAAISPPGANSMTWTDTGAGAGMAVCGATFAPDSFTPPAAVIFGYKSLLGVGQA